MEKSALKKPRANAGGFSFLPANPRRPNGGSCARHTDRSEGASESVTDSRAPWQRRRGASVPPCRDYICRTHRSRIRTHRRGHDRSVSSRSVGLRQRKRACESEGCCQRDCCNFHEVCPCYRQIGDNRIVCSTVPLKFSLGAIEAAKLLTSRRA
jgi:hypothetical protein